MLYNIYYISYAIFSLYIYNIYPPVLSAAQIIYLPYRTSERKSSNIEIIRKRVSQKSGSQVGPKLDLSLDKTPPKFC